MLRSNSREIDVAYHTRLTASLDVTRLLLKRGLPFRRHDESTSSSNQGNFLEILQWLGQHNDEVSKVLGKNAPDNACMIAPNIQRELTQACAKEVTLSIIDDIGDKIFIILVDEARDASLKEQMTVVLRYVNNEGCVIERFYGIVHVTDTYARSLKLAIDELFATHDISLSKLRGQGYDGASNMCAPTSHCVVAKGIRAVEDFFGYVSMIVNTTGASCKRNGQLKKLQHDRIIEQLEYDELTSGRGHNQETSLARPGITRWGSHYLTLLRLCSMWPSGRKS